MFKIIKFKKTKQNQKCTYPDADAVFGGLKEVLV